MSKYTVSSSGITITAEGYENAIEILNRQLKLIGKDVIALSNSDDRDEDLERKIRMEK